MRISDWSSDVCSSDLLAHFGRSGANLHQLDRTEEPVDLAFPDIAGAAMDLHRLVENAIGGFGGIHHRRGGERMDASAPALTVRDGGTFSEHLIGEAAQRLDPDEHVGKLGMEHMEARDRLAETLAPIIILEDSKIVERGTR